MKQSEVLIQAYQTIIDELNGSPYFMGKIEVVDFCKEKVDSLKREDDNGS